jgi:hypothetical protein
LGREADLQQTRRIDELHRQWPSSHQIQRLEHNVAGAVPIRRLEGVAHLARMPSAPGARWPPVAGSQAGNRIFFDDARCGEYLLLRSAVYEKLAAGVLRVWRRL